MWLAIGWAAATGSLLAVAAGLNVATTASLLVFLAGATLASVALILGGYYVVRSGNVDEMLRGEGVLVHWRYSPEEWQRFAQRERRERGRELKTALLFGAVVVVLYVATSPLIGVAVGGLSPFAVALIVSGVTALAFGGLGGLYLVLTDPRRGGTLEAVIARNGVLLNGSVLIWSLGLRLDDVRLTPGEPSLLEFDYAARSPYGTSGHTLRVPVAVGMQAEAERVAEELVARVGRREATPAPAGCPHTVLLPRWDDVADMGHEDRATSFVCEGCGEEFTPREVREPAVRSGARPR
jgi:hypothetical protein